MRLRRRSDGGVRRSTRQETQRSLGFERIWPRVVPMDETGLMQLERPERRECSGKIVPIVLRKIAMVGGHDCTDGIACDERRRALGLARGRECRRRLGARELDFAERKAEQSEESENERAQNPGANAPVFEVATCRACRRSSQGRSFFRVIRQFLPSDEFPPPQRQLVAVPDLPALLRQFHIPHREGGQPCRGQSHVYSL